MNEIKVLDLFSGIGGFSLGLERAGPFRTVAFCEREPFCRAVLKKHWPDTPIYDDVKTIDTDRLGRVDLICGGFPCQPWSAAGQQRGAEDDRDLWPVMASLIEDIQPQWVIGENVRGFVNELLGLQRSLSDLESIGYQAVTFVIPACAVDAPHRRDRVWIVAHAGDASRRRGTDRQQSRNGVIKLHGTHRETVAHADRAGQCTGQGRGQNGWDEARQDTGRRGADVADARSTRSAAGVPGQDKGQEGIAEKFDDRSHRRHGWSASDNWATEPDVGRVAHGVPNRVHRLKALGNAVVPQVVTQIGKAILAAES